MKFNKTFPYSLKKIAAIAGLAIAPVFVQSCKNNKDEPQPKHDVELTFNAQNVDNIHLDTIKKYAADNSVRYIYMMPENNGLSYQTYGTKVMSAYRPFLQERIDVAPEKVRGKGAFQFTRGSPAHAPEDSLWFVQNGWLINNLQNYR